MNELLPVDYDLVNRQLIALNENETDMLAIAANSVALLYQEMTQVNWCGIYVLRGDELVVGPFQGKPACVRIPLGEGVCGTAAKQLQTLRVADVDNFAGHISCDPDSKSELVVPLIRDDELLGVLDLDSPRTDRFSAEDQAGIEKFCDSLMKCIAAAGRNFI